MGDYQQNLVNVAIIVGVTVFMMSWDLVVPICSKIKKVFAK